MRDINPYKFLAIANGVLPAAIEHFSGNQKWNFASTTALLAPATIFAEDEYYTNTILGYSTSSMIKYAFDISKILFDFALPQKNFDVFFLKGMSEALKAFSAIFIAEGIRCIFNPVEDLKQIDVTSLEEEVKVINNETQDKILNLESSEKVTAQKAAPILDNYPVDQTHANDSLNLVDRNLINKNHFDYIPIVTTYEYPDHTVHIVNKYAADSYNNHHDLDYGFQI